jgi:hypothetical protein
MVKYQRKFHQQGLDSRKVLDEAASGAECGEIPGLRQAEMLWAPHKTLQTHPTIPTDSNLRRSTSLTDIGYGMTTYDVRHQQERWGNVSGTSDSQGVPIYDQDIATLQRFESISHSQFHITDQSSSATIAMNTNPVESTYKVPRQHVDHSHFEVVYPASCLRDSIQSNFGTFPASFVRSPSVQDVHYIQTTSQLAAFALQNASHSEEPHPNSYYYQWISSPMTHSQELMHQTEPSSTVIPTESHRLQSPQHEANYWYPYRAPVEVVTVGLLPTFGAVLSP